MNTNKSLFTMLPAALVASLALAGCAADQASENNDSTESDFTIPGVGTRCVFGAGLVVGAIEQKYLSLGGCMSSLGVPMTDEQITPDGRGHYTVFTNGSIYWRLDLGAHVVRGAIRDLWRDFGWEAGPLGYPMTDETATPDGVGRYSVFEGGSVYWTPMTGAHEVRGAIRDKWASLGWEAGELGYPVAGERDANGGITTEFQHGSITWDKKSHDLTVIIDHE